jgi:dihydroneopterin aldolase
MTSDIITAFAHPEERARAMSGDETPDRIMLRNHVVEVEIGAFQQERGRTQRVEFNVVVEVRSPDRFDDDVDKILSYDRITEAIQIELAVERLNLLETLAERVAERILTEPQALRCFLRIEKLDLGPGSLGVEIVRTADEVGRTDLVDQTVSPLLVLLSNAAIDRLSETAWIDDLSSAGSPVIISVAPGSLPVPDVAHPAPQRRIDLLALEQNAWVLAAKDARCVVVDSRTELEWAAQKGRISVWAPSKMVLDATDGPEMAADAFALTLWLADQMGAARIIAVGEDWPADPKVEQRKTAAATLL